MPLAKLLPHKEAAVWFLTSGGLVFDLFIAPALIWRKTRYLAFGACVFFHLTNHIMFRIGFFPILMLGASLIFFEPDWPEFCCSAGFDYDGFALGEESI